MNRFFFILLFALALVPRCARVGSITGGPKDTLGPVVRRVSPAMGSVNFKDKHIYVEFDEYVQLKDLHKEFYTSPGMKKTPTVTLRGKGFRIDIPDTLKGDQTYAFDFAGAVVDNHEGNPLNGFRYVFSTGATVDSLVMSGYTVDARRGDSVSKTFVYFFDAKLDSVPGRDSTLFNHLPEAVGRAQNNGIFVARNLKAKDYRVYVVEDRNGNGMYDAGVDKVGFDDGVHNPAEMPDFEAWYDSTRRYVTARPQLYYRMFVDERPARQIMATPTRPQRHKVMMSFGAPWPGIERLVFEGVDSTEIITEYLKPTRDSMALWFDVPGERLGDTIKGEIVYMRPDSTGVERPFTQQLRLGWKKSESSSERRERERRERDLAEGREVEPLPNPFKYTLDAGDVHPERGIEIDFEMPLAWHDVRGIRLTTGDSTDIKRVSVRMTQDTARVRKWRLDAAWQQGVKYRLSIAEGALRDVAGQTNDSIVRMLTVMDADKMSTVAVNVVGKTPRSLYVLQLTDEGGRVIEEKRHVSTGTVKFNYVPPGKVRLLVIEDADGNGEWSTGRLVTRTQPERTELYMDKPGEATFTVRAGWIEEKLVDMNELFAPVTMRSINEKLEREEAVRMEKWLEYRDRRREQQRRQQNSGGTSAGDMMMQGAAGLGLPGF